MNGPTHTVGSHSDDRGGESDWPCYCDQNVAPSNSKSEDISTFTIESYYVKKSDGFVYYYWRMQGSDTWNIQKTAMKEVPAVEMATWPRHQTRLESDDAA